MQFARGVVCPVGPSSGVARASKAVGTTLLTYSPDNQRFDVDDEVRRRPRVNQDDAIAHNWNFARDFPEASPEEIHRPHLLETIADILGADTPIVFLEGEEGDGATTMKESAMRRCIALCRGREVLATRLRRNPPSAAP